MSLSTKTLALIGLALTNLFWASNAVLARFVTGDIPPLTLSFGRWLFALLILLPFAWPHLKGCWSEVRRQWQVVLVLGLLGITIYNTVLYLAAYSTTAVNITLVSSTLPLITLLAVWLMLRQRPGNWQLLGIGASLLGVLIIIARGSLESLLGLEFSRGDLLIFGIACCWSVYSIILRKYPLKVHPVALLTILMIAGIPLLLLLFLVEYFWVVSVSFTSSTFSAFAYVAIFPSILAYLLWGYGVKEMGPNVAALSCYLMPLFTALMAIPMLGEVLHLYHLVGGLLILVGLYLGVWFKGPVKNG